MKSYPSSLVILLLSAPWAACNSSVTSHAISLDPIRSGSEMQSISAKYRDDQPQLSDDGTKVIFLSGRDGDDKTWTTKAYKADWPAGGSPGALSRATASDIGVESEARLSPDGAWIAMVATKNQQSGVYLQPWDSAKAPVLVVAGTAAASSLAFSPDSKMLAWIANDGGSSKAMLVAIGDGTATALAATNQAQVSKDGDIVAQVFWLPSNANGYVLATTVLAAPGAASATYYQRSFADLAAAKTATSVTWFTGQPALTIRPAAAADKVLLARRNASSDKAATPEVGDGLPPPPPPPASLSINVRTEPVYASVTAPAPNGQPTRYAAPPGFDVLSTALTADGKTAIMLERLYYRCAGDIIDRFGSAFTIAPADATNTNISWRSPKLAAPTNSASPAGLSFSYGQGPCDRKLGDRTMPVDDQMTQMAVNGAATAASFRAAYVTTFTTHFDAACGLIAGDQEVQLMDYTATGAKFYPLAKNAAPLVDADRGDQPACGL